MLISQGRQMPALSYAILDGMPRRRRALSSLAGSDKRRAVGIKPCAALQMPDLEPDDRELKLSAGDNHVVAADFPAKLADHTSFSTSFCMLTHTQR